MRSGMCVHASALIVALGEEGNGVSTKLLCHQVVAIYGEFLDRVFIHCSLAS